MIKVMDPIQLSLSLAGIAVRSQRLMIDFLKRRPDLGGLNETRLIRVIPRQLGKFLFALVAS